MHFSISRFNSLFVVVILSQNILIATADKMFFAQLVSLNIISIDWSWYPTPHTHIVAPCGIRTRDSLSKRSGALTTALRPPVASYRG